jgi:hypothetical protein
MYFTIKGAWGEHSWLKYYATSWKVMGLSPDEVDFFSIYLILPGTLWPAVNSVSNRNEYQESYGAGG